MAQYYGTPTVNDTSGMYEIVSWVNRVPADGLLFPVILFVIWIISFIAMKGYSSARAWTFASFLCTVLSIIMAILDFVSPKIMYLFIFLTLVGFIWLKLEEA